MRVCVGGGTELFTTEISVFFMCSRKWERVGKGWVKGAGAQGSRGWLPEGLAGGPARETHYGFQSVHPLPWGLGTGWRQGAGGRQRG